MVGQARATTDGWRRECAVALAVALGVAASGVPVGLLWYLVAPKARFMRLQDVAFPADDQPEQFVADDGWYVFLTLGAGVVAAAVVWMLVRRHRGPLVLAALTLGAAAAGVLAAWLGHRIGQPHFQELLRSAPNGTEFYRPPDVRTKDVGLSFGFLPRVQGAVLLEAMTAVAVYTLLSAFHPTPDLANAPAEAPPVGPGVVSSGSMGPPARPGEPAPHVPHRAAPPPD